MYKKVLMGAVTALSIGVILTLNIGAAQAASNIRIDETGNVMLVSDHEETDGVTALQLSLKIDSDAGADVSFEFSSANDIRISEYRYHDDTNCLNIYIADSKPLFDGVDMLELGTVSAKDIDGNSVDVQIEIVKDSLKYVRQNTLMDGDFEAEIATKPVITTTATTRPAAATTASATTKPAAAAATFTTTTAKPVTTATEPAATAPASTTEANNGHVASDEELCKWAINDYQKTTGIIAARAEININSEELYEIALSDDSGEILDIYVIDPVTGTGANSADEEINLPQTGNNSMKNILIALGAIALTGLGLCGIRRSGMIRREEYEK